MSSVRLTKDFDLCQRVLSLERQRYDLPPELQRLSPMMSWHHGPLFSSLLLRCRPRWSDYRILQSVFVIVALTQCTEPAGPSTELCSDLEQFDSIMVKFMASRDIHAGTLGVMKNSRVVYDKSFGWKDEDQKTALPTGVMMRLASVTKPITAAAVRELVEDGRLGLDDHVFDLGQPTGGLLDLEPFRSLGDTLLADITIRHLLQHRGGWDRDLEGDLAFKEIQIANAMNVPSPPGRANTVRYILGQPLQFAPGSKKVYANIGYLILGLIIEEVTGTDYLSYVLETVFEPLGFPDGDIIQGRTFPSDRHPREPWYDSQSMSLNVFDPDGPRVRTPDGGWDLESMISFGGLVASTLPILEFLGVYQVSGDNIGARRTGTESWGWKRYHTGSLSGTNTLARQRGDGINYVVLLNKRPSSGDSYSSQLRAEIDEFLDRGLICWPRP